MAAAAGNWSTTSLSFFMKAHGAAVEEELSTLARSLDGNNGTTNKEKRG